MYLFHQIWPSGSNITERPRTEMGHILGGGASSGVKNKVVNTCQKISGLCLQEETHMK